ncbi:MAG: hypothetical protein WDZ86_04730 [Gammaproteobacteria bacterium]
MDFEIPYSSNDYLKQRINTLNNELARARSAIGRWTVVAKATERQIEVLQQLYESDKTDDASDDMFDTGVGSGAAMNGASHSVDNTDGGINQLSVREATKFVLKNAGRAMTTAEIKDELERLGFQYQASTPLTTRIGNDLKRLRNQGFTKKRKNRHFFAEGGT